MVTISRPAGAGLEERLDRWSERRRILYGVTLTCSIASSIEVPRCSWRA